MKLGARILKTGVAIVLALYVAEFLQLPSPVFAGIAAVFAVQPTIYRSYLSIVEQIQANLIGAGVAVLFVLLFGQHTVVIGLAAIIAIALILKFKIENTIGLALVTLIAIMEIESEDFILFSFIRFGTIMVGVFSSFLVNLIFLPPKYETKLYNQISSVSEEIFKWLRLSSRQASEFSLLKKDIEKLNEKLVATEQLYLNFKEERYYLKQKEAAKLRKLVVYRQMINTNRKSFTTLKRFHRYENELLHLPVEILSFLKDQLDILMIRHEQLILQFVGKSKLNADASDDHRLSVERRELSKIFLQEMQLVDEHDQFETYHLLHILSSVLEYEEQVSHLETLISSFQCYHQDENEVDIKDA
ncbi:membrane protein [Bacillus coahuilensis p1.1.43]|uniref:Membrane protein n=1 Tax=Bacillus coahuilensis p1.1.43 TaxID=1150625 RepID=A0A147KBJ1_9BACI|nr:aromatic acid exporter family protein [Bacillus coahuilensis]KUP08528.1 membrane protein [Bacillus coahuilensis p1.1.43]